MSLEPPLYSQSRNDLLHPTILASERNDHAADRSVGHPWAPEEIRLDLVGEDEVCGEGTDLLFGARRYCQDCDGM